MNSTKQSIADALKRLLRSKPFTKVTINDIARECGVTRMTFYYHFTDIYDLLRWVCDSDVDTALRDRTEAGDWQRDFLAILETIRDNRTLVTNVCRSVDRRQVERYVYAAAESLLAEVIEASARDILLSDADKLVAVDFYKYAMVGIGLEWVDDDMRVPPQRLVTNTSRMVQGDFRPQLMWLSRTACDVI